MPDQDDNEPEISELKDLHIREISLVDRPANMRPFLLYKAQDEGGDTHMPELTAEETAEVELALNTEVDSEDGLMKALTARSKDGKLSDKARNALKGALRLLGSQKELADVMKSATDEPEPAKKPEEKPPEKTEEKPPEKTEEKPAESEVEKALRVDLTKLTDENVELRKAVTGLVAKEEAAVVDALVKEIDLGSMSVEDQREFLGSLDEKQQEKMKAWASGVNKAAELSREIGTPRRGEPEADSPDAEIMKRAKGLVEKDATGKLDIADAILAVRQEDPELRERSRLASLGKGG